MPGTEASGRSGRKTGDERARAILGCGLMILAIEEAAKLGGTQSTEQKVAGGGATMR